MSRFLREDARTARARDNRRMSAAKKPSSADAMTPAARLAEVQLKSIVGYQLAQAAIVTMQVFVSRVGSRFALRPVEYTILALVTDNDGISPRQLAQALAVTPPNITAWLDRLEARGLLRRQRNTTDARSHHLHATPEGAELAQRASAALIEGERETLTTLSAAEHAMLLELLHKAARSRRRA